jgi:hypothetical protein
MLVFFFHGRYKARGRDHSTLRGNKTFGPKSLPIIAVFPWRSKKKIFEGGNGPGRLEIERESWDIWG